MVPSSGTGAGRIPVEVKGDGSTEIRNAATAIRKSFGRGVVATRTMFDLSGDVPLIPTPVLLAALGEHTQRPLSGI